MLVVDASALIAFLDGTDVHHGRAVDALVAVERFFVHPVTLAEVLVHPVRTGAGNEVVARLHAIGMITSPVDVDSLTLAELRVESGLKMPDCLVVAVARSLDADVLTFDDRMRTFVA